jgi:hypothetical protein
VSGGVPRRGVVWGCGRPDPSQQRAFFTRNGATKILSLDRLKQALFSVLLSNPLLKVDFYSIVDRTLAGLVVSLCDRAFELARRPPANSIPFPLAGFGGAGVLLPLQSFFGLIFRSVCTFQNKNTWSKSKKELKVCHSFPQPQLY